ncbi:MAG TPA: PKD domain-containing protein [Vicinamibacteria bacterium]|nr:PKD domain-containing protein [Vicinamibacteria bacterium]
MSLQSIRNTSSAAGVRALLLGLAAALGGCGLDEVEIPELAGPSGHAFSLVATVNPDVLLADAVSLAVVQATVRGPDGRPVGGRAVFFQVTDENFNYVDLGTVQSSTAPVRFPAPQVTEVTGSNGIAQVIYRVPERISVTAIQRVNILVRLVGEDFQGQGNRSVTIQLRPAEVRRFPENFDNTAPNCAFSVDPEVPPDNGFYPTNFTVRFRTASSDEDGRIVQYFWDFGDGFQTDKPDTEHHWNRAGNYPVTHVVTDNNGAIDSCSVVIGVR